MAAGVLRGFVGTLGWVGGPKAWGRKAQACISFCPRAVGAVGGTNVVGCGSMWQNLPLPTGILCLFLLLLPVPEHWAEPLPPSWERQGRQRLTPASTPVPAGAGPESGLCFPRSHPLGLCLPSPAGLWSCAHLSPARVHPGLGVVQSCPCTAWHHHDFVGCGGRPLFPPSSPGCGFSPHHSHVPGGSASPFPHPGFAPLGTLSRWLVPSGCPLL